MEISSDHLIAFFGGALAAMLVGWIFAWKWVRLVKYKAKNAIELAQQRAEVSIREAQAEANLKFERKKAETDQQFSDRQKELEAREREWSSQRQKVDEKIAELALEQTKAQALQAATDAEKKKFETYSETYRHRLQQVAKLTEGEAKDLLRNEVVRDSGPEIQEIRREILLESEEAYKLKAQRMLVAAMQRISGNVPNEFSATVVEIPNEDMKGRIIGREGRNIKAFEMATGTTLMIDETPGTILVSSFDPVRREIAKFALERLVNDGRIHPVSIEEAVADVTDEVKENVIALGEKAVLRLRLVGVHPEVVSLLGKLHYRLSNNQNTLDHSIEVSFIGSLLASELGVDPEPAKRAGLFHDMGKAVEHQYEGSHALAAARILQRHGEDARVCNAVAAHHNEVSETSIYAGILKTADGLSASRPGARSDSMDGYIQRVRSLEAIACSFEGVQEAYALQAGKEIRIIVAPEKIDDEQAKTIARKIRLRIENEIQYPGTIKISVIRERRYQEIAK